MRLPSIRNSNIIGIIVCILLIFTACYFQYERSMQPCLLCILQRWVLGIIAVALLFAIIHRTRARVYQVIAFFASITGLLIAARQSWLQHQPPFLENACLPGFSYLLQTKPIPEVIRILLHADSDCARVAWRFLYLSMAEWMIIIFAIFVVFSAALLVFDNGSD